MALVIINLNFKYYAGNTILVIILIVESLIFLTGLLTVNYLV